MNSTEVIVMHIESIYSYCNRPEPGKMCTIKIGTSEMFTPTNAEVLCSLFMHVRLQNLSALQSPPGVGEQLRP